jgi:hypothetical protein
MKLSEVLKAKGADLPESALLALDEVTGQFMCPVCFNLGSSMASGEPIGITGKLEFNCHCGDGHELSCLLVSTEEAVVASYMDIKKRPLGF